MKALAIIFAMIYFYYDYVFPYAFEIGQWLISQHIVMYASLLLALVFYFSSYRLTHYRNLHINGSLIKPNQAQKKKHLKFLITGILISLLIVGASTALVINQVKQANLYDDQIAGAIVEKKILQAKGCVLLNHQIKYNANLLPIIVRKNIKIDDVKYIDDSVSISLRPLKKGSSRIKVEYQCEGNTQYYSAYRFRDLMR